MRVVELARQIIAETGTKMGVVLVSRQVAKRYTDLVGMTGRENSERAESTLTLPSTIKVGTVGVTQDSDVVTGDATALAAWATEQLVGRYFRVVQGEPIYRIGAQSPTGLILDTDFVGATAATSGYEVFARRHSLGEDVRHVQQITHEEVALKEVTVEWLDRIFPDRDELDDEPRFWAPSGLDDEGKIQVEIFPQPTDTRDILVRYTYFRDPNGLKMEDTLPSHVDAHVLEAGVFADVCRWEAGRLMGLAEAADTAPERRAALVEMAGIKSNEARAYERDFVRLKSDGMRASRVGRGPRINVEDYNDVGKRPIVRARDEVWRNLPN